MKNHLLNILVLLLVGVCIGILSGLSVSPVIQTVLSSVLTLVITVLSVWYGISPAHDSETTQLKYKISLVPAGMLILGITLGCFMGIYMRTHDVLGANAQVVKGADPKASPKSNDVVNKTVLFSISQDTCKIIQGYSGNALISYLRSLGNPHISSIIDSIGENKPMEIKETLQGLCR